MLHIEPLFGKTQEAKVPFLDICSPQVGSKRVYFCPKILFGARVAKVRICLLDRFSCQMPFLGSGKLLANRCPGFEVGAGLVGMDQMLR